MKHIITILTLVSYLMMTMGCSSLTDIPPEKLKGEKINSVLLLTTIHGLQLKTGEKILLKERTGSFDSTTKTLIGMTNENVLISERLEGIDQIILREYYKGSDKLIHIYSNDFQNDFNNKRWKVINGISVRAGNYLKFDDNGGLIDPKSKKVTGYSIQGDFVEIPVEDIMYMQSKKINWTKTLVAVAGVTGVVYLVASFIATKKLFDSDTYKKK